MAQEAAFDRLTVTHDGSERVSLAAVPANLAEGAPVLLALHGGGSSGSQFARLRRAFLADALQRGWAVAVPTGTSCLRGGGSCWDDRDLPADLARADADDVGFLRALVRTLHDRHGIDSARVFVVGFSNGAGMAYRFAAEAPDLVAAASAVAGTVGRTQGRTDYTYAMTPPPTAPVPLLIVRGMDDDLVPYYGGVRPRGTYQVLAAQYDASFWAEANGCDLGAVEKQGVAGLRNPTADTVEVYDYRMGCRDDATVRLVGVGRLGHAWPTARDGYDADHEIVAFFERHAR